MSGLRINDVVKAEYLNEYDVQINKIRFGEEYTVIGFETKNNLVILDVQGTEYYVHPFQVKKVK